LGTNIASSKHDALATRIVQELRQDILEGRLLPGMKIGQEAVAKRFGTSRLPVRQAFARLASEGLITSEQHKGASVALLEFNGLLEIYLMRERLEPLAIAESVQYLTVEQLRNLRALLEAMEASTEQKAFARWIELDTHFHLESYQAAPYPRLLSLIETLFARAQQYRRIYLTFPQTLELSNLEHRLLMEAFERRDSHDAEQLQYIHIRRTRLGLTKYPHLFGVPQQPPTNEENRGKDE
jgi:DNA-binding GntR family transcriptional regulator